MKAIRILFVIIGASVLYAQRVEPPFNNSGSSGGVGSVAIHGTTNQISISGTCTSSSTINCTVALPSAITLPGTINKYTLTAPATGATLALADGSTLATSGAHSVTFTLTGDTNVTLPTSGTLLSSVGGSNTQVLYNNAGALGGISGATTDGTTLTLVGPVLGTPASATLTNATGLPTAGLVNGAVTAVKMVNAGVFTGDVTTTFPAITVARVNGITYSATAAAHSVEVITTANTTATAKVIPDCHTAGSSALTYTQSTDAFGCNTISGGGGALTVTVDSTALGAYSTVTFVSGTGISLGGVDTGTTNQVTVSVGTHVLLDNAAQNVTAKKTFIKTSNVAALSWTPSVVPVSSVVAGDSYVDSTSFLLGISNGASWQYPYNFTGTPATASQIIGGSATAGSTSVFSTSGTGTTVCLTGACTLNNPVINSLVNLSVYDGPIIAPLYLSSAVNPQTGTTYTYANTDRGKLVTHTNASSIAGSLPQANGSTFIAGWYMDVQNRGAGTLTITPTTSTIDGSSSLALTTAQGVRIVSDGTNYFTQRGIGGSGSSAFSSLTTGTNNSGQTLTVGSTSTLGTSGTGTIKATSLVDSNQVNVLLTEAATTPVNYFSMKNSASTADVILKALGSDSDISMDFWAKGVGGYNFRTGTSGSDLAYLTAAGFFKNGLTLNMDDGSLAIRSNGKWGTASTCSSSASPAVCSALSAGAVVVAASATTVTVNTTAVSNDSQIILTFDSSLGTKLGVTCNATEPALFGVSARVNATSFTITSSAPLTNPACFSYFILN